MTTRAELYKAFEAHERIQTLLDCSTLLSGWTGFYNLRRSIEKEVRRLEAELKNMTDSIIDNDTEGKK